jgi:hypothetical protein
MSLCNGEEFHKESRNTAAEVRNTITMRLLVTEFHKALIAEETFAG